MRELFLLCPKFWWRVKKVVFMLSAARLMFQAPAMFFIVC